MTSYNIISYNPDGSWNVSYPTTTYVVGTKGQVGTPVTTTSFTTVSTSVLLSNGYTQTQLDTFIQTGSLTNLVGTLAYSNVSYNGTSLSFRVSSSGLPLGTSQQYQIVTKIFDSNNNMIATVNGNFQNVNYGDFNLNITNLPTIRLSSVINLYPQTTTNVVTTTDQTVNNSQATVSQNHSVTLRSTLTNAAQTFNVDSATDLQIPALIPSGSTIIILSDITTASAATNTLNDIVNWVQSQSFVTTNYAVVIKATDGVQQTFIISGSDNTTLNTAGFLQGGALVMSDTTTTNPTNATLIDIGNFIAAHATNSIVTPAPTNFTNTVNQDTINLSWVSANPVTIIMNNAQIATNYAANSYSRFGVAAGTYTFTIFATKTGQQDSNAVQTTATVTFTGINPTPTPTANNYAYNIQIPNVANAIRLVTATTYGTSTTNNAFPARQFVNNILNINNVNIPTTLNAVFLTYVSDTPNEVTAANAINGYFPTPTPQSPPKNILGIAGGLFAGLLTLSLFTSGDKPKGKRNHA